MALLKNQFYKQISLATITKVARKELNVGESMEFWEADVVFNLNSADFSFTIREPSSREVKKEVKEKMVFNPLIAYDPNPPKRFWTKEEAEHFILFNIIQVYKPLKNFIKENGLDEQFNKLLEDHPEKILKELENGRNWLVD